MRTLTDKPVRVVVNTHWHDDHVVGNQVYAESFPGVQFVAHAATRAYLPAQGAENRRKWHEGGLTQFVDLLRGFVRDNKSFGGGPIDEEERASYLSGISLGEGYMTVPATYEPVLPTVTLEDKLTLYQGTRAVEILFLGRGHTSGDLVVRLPREGIVAAGDLVVFPVPLVGSDQSHVSDWGRDARKTPRAESLCYTPRPRPTDARRFVRQTGRAADGLRESSRRERRSGAARRWTRRARA